MTILDTSIVVPMVRSDISLVVKKLADEFGDMDIYLTSLSQLELLQGARDEAEWKKLERFLSTQDIIEPPPIVWWQAPRTYFDLRCQGRTVRSILDCVIAEIAISRNMLLIHNDRDFETIATVRPLQHRRMELGRN